MRRPTPRRRRRRRIAAARSARALKKRRELRPLDFESLSFKVADLGNACWSHHHFTSDIQTRQYRCPEVIIGAGYDTSADMWSAACVFFEAATGDVLFSPHSGDGYSRDEDHLAQAIELLGRMPKKLALEGKHSRELFNKAGELRGIKQKDLKYWDLRSVLISKYKWADADAAAFAAFLQPMLDFNRHRRATAKAMLAHDVARRPR